LTPPKYTPTDAIEFFKYLIEAGVNPTDLRASFDYLPDWGMRLSGVPNSGGWLKSNTGRGDKSMIGFICINQWHFTYDVIYPIRLTIKDDSAFAGEGFVFQMAFPVLVNNNLPERKYFGVRQFESVDFDRPFCEVTGENPVDIRVTGFTEASPIATELDNVTLAFRCLTEECIIGETVADEGYYRLRTTVPMACINPIIVAEKEGYLPSEGTLTGDTLTIPMKKIRPFEVEVVVHPYNSHVGEWNPPRYKLRSTEKVLIHIGLKGAMFDQYLEFPSNETEIIELVEGKEKYDMDITLNIMGNPVGGYYARDLEIGYSDFSDADTIELHVFEYVPNPIQAKTPAAEKLRMDMFAFMVKGNYTEKLRPTFR